MTYWVIAKIGEKIYMAADSRLSRPNTQWQAGMFKGGDREWSDSATKLWTVNCPHHRINFGICWAGLVMHSGCNIQNIVRSFKDSLESRDLLGDLWLRNSADVIKALLIFIRDKYGVEICDSICKNNIFGVGGYFNGTGDIAEFTDGRGISSVPTYLEASLSSSPCLEGLYSEGAKLFSLDSIELQQALVGGKGDKVIIDHIKRLVELSRNITGLHTPQTVGGPIDSAISVPSGIAFALGGIKESSETWHPSLMPGSDREPESRFMPTYNPDNDPRYSSMSTRK